MKNLVTSLLVLSLQSTVLGQNPEQANKVRKNPVTEIQAGGFSGIQLMPEMPTNVTIRSNNSVEFDIKNGKMRYDGGVQLFTNNNLQLFANRALLDTKTKTIHLSGDVTIYQGTIVHRGEKADYDYGSETLDTTGLRTSIDPLLMRSDSLQSVQEGNRTIYIGKNSQLTTHDVQTPNFWFKAEKIQVYPDDKITFANMNLYAGEHKLLWLPYYAQSLNADLGYHFLPGARSNWGAFLLNKYGVMLGSNSNLLTGQKEEPWLLAQYLVDLRSKRGIGTGIDLYDTRLSKNENLGWLKLYYTNDLAPSTQRSGIKRGFVNEDRYKIEFKNRFEVKSIGKNQSLFDVNITWLSDDYYLEDFNPEIYNLDPQPDNTISYINRSNYYQAGALARFNLNDFYQSDARLPELFFDQVKRPVLGNGILHEGSTSLGYYKEDFAISPDRDYARLHTYQELSKPLDLIDGLTINPRLGIGYTRYWAEGETNDSTNRKHLYAGLDTSLKFTKRYPHIHNKSLGLNQVLHVMRPYANLSVLSTDPLDSNFGKIDRLTPTVRPRPFDVARFNAIDDLTSWSILRLGVSNELLTKRNEGTHQWLVLNSYFDYFIDDPELNRDISNIYNDIFWTPLPWLSLGLETQFPVAGDGFTEVSSSFNFMPNDNLELRLRHRYLDSHPTLIDSNRIDFKTYYRINSDWGLGFYQQWELDDGTLERQQYAIHRNFDSWVASLGLLHRDNREEQEYGIIFSLTLKEIPSINLPLNFDAQ